MQYMSPAYALAKGGPSGYFRHFSPVGMAMGGGIGGSGGAGGVPLGLLNLFGK
jgi:hypothetical protein